MAARNMYFSYRVLFLCVLFLYTPQTLQEEIGRKSVEDPDTDRSGNGRKSVAARKLLYADEVFEQEHDAISTLAISKGEYTTTVSSSRALTAASLEVKGTTTSEPSQNPTNPTSKSGSSSLSSISRSLKSSTWRTGGGLTTSWRSSSFSSSSSRSASSAERSLTSRTDPSNSWTTEGSHGDIPGLTTVLDSPPISKEEETTPHPLSKEKPAESPTSQEGPVKVLPSEAESHQTPSSMTPSTSVSPSTSPSEVEEPAESSSVSPELDSWSDYDESKNNVLTGIAGLAFLVLLIIVVGVYLIRCCVCRSQNRAKYVALSTDPPTRSTGGETAPEITQYRRK